MINFIKDIFKPYYIRYKYLYSEMFHNNCTIEVSLDPHIVSYFQGRSDIEINYFIVEAVKEYLHDRKK